MHAELERISDSGPDLFEESMKKLIDMKNKYTEKLNRIDEQAIRKELDTKVIIIHQLSENEDKYNFVTAYISGFPDTKDPKLNNLLDNAIKILESQDQDLIYKFETLCYDRSKKLYHKASVMSCELDKRFYIVHNGDDEIPTDEDGLPIYNLDERYYEDEEIPIVQNELNDQIKKYNKLDEERYFFDKLASIFSSVGDHFSDEL